MSILQDAMYKYLTAGNDLYNKETGEYVFQYNDAGALCTYYLKPYGENKKCTYVLAYFKSHHLNVGDEWRTSDYIQWIQKKHEEFRSANHLPEYIAYWKEHNEDLLEKFLQFIGFYN